MRKAMIFGITGQDGYYLAKHLLPSGYFIFGVSRKFSNNQEELFADYSNNIKFLEYDITDSNNINRIINDYKPDEIYNLAAQSNVFLSFKNPLYTMDVNVKGCLNILEAVRGGRLPCKIFQAGSSEMYGKSYSVKHHIFEDDSFTETFFIDENTPMKPVSPYGIAKLAAYNLVKSYREAYGIFACNGILFNHESPRRGLSFLSQKVCSYAKKLLSSNLKLLPNLKLGNIKVSRDWGYAPDFVEAMHLMLCDSKPDDYIVATGKLHTVEDFVIKAFCVVNPFFKYTWKNYIEIDPNLYRPIDVDSYCPNINKIEKHLGWKPKTTFQEMIKLMVLG